jgi:hypothetical protein
MNLFWIVTFLCISSFSSSGQAQTVQDFSGQCESKQDDTQEIQIKMDEIAATISSANRDLLCGIAPDHKSEIVMDRDFLSKIEWKLRVDFSVNLSKEGKQILGSLDDVEFDLQNGNLVVTKLSFTNFVMLKAPGTAEFEGRTHKLRPIKLSCEE